MRYKLISSLRVTKTDECLSPITNQFTLHSPSRAHLSVHQISPDLGHHFLLKGSQDTGNDLLPLPTPPPATPSAIVGLSLGPEEKLSFCKSKAPPLGLSVSMPSSLLLLYFTNTTSAVFCKYA